MLSKLINVLIKNKRKKEYLKYEKGKVISIKPQDEKKNDNKIYNDIVIQKNENKIEDIQEIEKIKKEDIEDQVFEQKNNKLKQNFKKLFNFNYSIIKNILIVVFVILLLLWLYSFYNNQKSIQVDSDMNISTDKNNESHIKNKEINKSVSLKDCIKEVNDLNLFLIKDLDNDIEIINLFINGKATRITTIHKLQKNFEEKKNIYVAFSLSKNDFDKYNISDFYKYTEDRIINSLNFSLTIIDNLDKNKGKDLISNHLKTFNKNEIIYSRNQKNELIEILKNNNIKYELNEDNDAIIYYIKH